MKHTMSGWCVAGALALGVPLAGVSLASCGAFGVFEPLFKSAKDTSVPHQKDTALYVDAENGSIEIVKAEGDSVQIHADVEAKSQERADKTQIVATRDKDGALHVSLQWPDGKPKNSEGCSFVVKVPGATLVHSHTTNGNITCRDVGMHANLATENGSVKVWNMAGDVKARTTNGNVELTGVPSADAGTTNGSVNVTLSDTPQGAIKCETTNGSVTLYVPASFDQTLECATTNGSVKISAPGGKATTQTSTHAIYVFGKGETKGTLETTNGSVHVKAKEAPEPGKK